MQLLFHIWTASRKLDSLAYREGITDAYNQYFVNDRGHTEKINCVYIANYHLFLSLEQVIVSCMVLLSDNFYWEIS